jgi:hypothetical protein
MAMTVQEAYNILTKLHNYTGPETKRAISNFINARDIPIAVKNRGGMIGMQEGGAIEPEYGQPPPDPKIKLPFFPPVEPPEEDKEYTIEDVEAGQKKLVGDVATDPSKAIKKPEVSKVDPDTKGTEITTGTGQAPKDATTVTETSTVDTPAQAKEPTTTDVTDAKTFTSSTQMKKLMDDVDPAKGDVTKEVVGQTKEDTAVSDLDAAQIDTPQTVKDAPTRKAETGEMIDETPVVDQARVKEAEATAASVQDELTTLMSQFDDGATPPWAAGSMRKAMQTLAARGLGASSLAGQAVIQAAMEAALPIAQIDTANKQQVALANAQQRAKFLQIEFDQAFQTKVMNAAKVSEIANMNFTAQQQVALENAKMAQTVDLSNLNARQALVMAEAAQLSQLELAGLSNLQQAQVENAKNFLQIDMANLANEQQTELFKGQQNANALLTDVASQNATEQFNAKSANQSAQFDNSLMAQVRQFNANQKNAIAQFNANEENAIGKFNAEVQNQRDQFNANNALIIAQANAKWRQDTTTLNTATQNQANFEFAKQTNALTNKQIDQIWQRERDIMSFSFTQSENALDRTLKVLLGDKTLEGLRLQADATEGAANAELFARVFFGNKGLFGFF